MCAINPVQFSRGENGQLIVNFSNAKDFNVMNVGKIDGNVSMQVGSTGETNELGVSFEQYNNDESAKIKLANSDGRNYSFSGYNYDISAQSGSAARMINMDTINSKVDLTNTTGTNGILMSETSGLNQVALGSGNDIYLDNGVYNLATDTGGSNTFETGTSSIGSIITAGSGSDVFKIGGSYGVIDAGGGNDTIVSIGHMIEDGDVSSAYSYRNIIIGGDGNDTMTDHGAYNLFMGEDGYDTYVGSGSNGIANLGFGEDEEGSGTINSDAFNTFIFNKPEETDKETGEVYNYYDTLAEYNWSLNKFLSDDQSGFDSTRLRSTVFEKIFSIFAADEE